MHEEQLEHLRHSAAHLLAAAVEKLWPNAKRTIGPATATGFYYDFDFGEEKVTEADLKKIEKTMKKLVGQWKAFEREEVSKTEALERFASNEYKCELIEEFATDGQVLTFYHSGAFSDLCRGGHCEQPAKELKYFALLSLAGAYWRGDEKNKMLTRIYGTAFATQEELDAYLLMLEEAKKRDHRKLGKELDLFAFSDLVGPGLPLFTPTGTLLRDELTRFVWHLMRPYGYARVHIPHIAKSDLYKTSGHWDKFADDIFHVSSHKTEQEFVLKPMNCPHHTQIYASRPRSYRDLPLRYSEVTTVYRDENAGQLQGLSRVRSITQDDAHVFCRLDQVQEEARAIYEIVSKFYEAFSMPLRIRLSIHDEQEPENYLGDAAVWDRAVGTLRDMLDSLGKEYDVVPGEAAFYGPKVDFIATDAIGREWQLATIQLDFNLPERFDLEYVDADNQKQRPVMIHRAILGSVERFMAVLIEHYAGAFPFWLAPEQVRLVPVSDEFIPFAQEWEKRLLAIGARVSVDSTKEGVGKKIRAAAMKKVPWTIVIGEKEVAGGDFQVNIFGEKKDRVVMQADIAAEVERALQFPV